VLAFASADYFFPVSLAGPATAGTGLWDIGGGHVEGRGEVDFGRERHLDLDLKVSGISVGDVVGGEWAERLSGTIRGPVRIAGPPGDLVQEGTLHVDGAVVETLTAAAEECGFHPDSLGRILRRRPDLNAGRPNAPKIRPRSSSSTT
jgi:hypothetical protein